MRLTEIRWVPSNHSTNGSERPNDLLAGNLRGVWDLHGIEFGRVGPIFGDRLEG